MEEMKADFYGKLSNEVIEALSGIFESEYKKIHEMYAKGLLTADEAADLNKIILGFVTKYF